jgi:hypothetical protein
MYDNFKLCPELKPREVCFVVEQYREGLFERKFHMHVPKHRLSIDALGNVLRALVFKFEELRPQTVVRAYLNERGKDPSAYKLMWQTSFPEPGALRQCCGTNTRAWADRVIAPAKFRNG